MQISTHETNQDKQNQNISMFIQSVKQDTKSHEL